MNKDRASIEEEANFTVARKLTSALMGRIGREGFKAKIVSVDHLGDLREDIETNRQQGLITEEVYRVDLSRFVFGPPPEMPEAKSVIIVSTPQPHIRMTFDWDGRMIATYIPPTYSAAITQRVKDILEEILAPAGFHLFRAWIPLKLTAVHSGLARYGKNNITFVEGMGSYQRLNAFFSELPCVEDSWGELKVMEQCTKCTACRDKCPTGAISSDRFVIRAERCLTYLNEHKGEFPAWVETGAHHCLVGCLFCQSFCPVNRKTPATIEDGPTFTSQETELILQVTPKDKLPDDLTRKLEEFGFQNDLPEIARNLRVLLDHPQNLAIAPGLLQRGRV